MSALSPSNFAKIEASFLILVFLPYPIFYSTANPVYLLSQRGLNPTLPHCLHHLNPCWESSILLLVSSFFFWPFPSIVPVVAKAILLKSKSDQITSLLGNKISIKFLLLSTGLSITRPLDNPLTSVSASFPLPGLSEFTIYCLNACHRVFDQ